MIMRKVMRAVIGTIAMTLWLIIIPFRWVSMHIFAHLMLIENWARRAFLNSLGIEE